MRTRVQRRCLRPQDAGVCVWLRPQDAGVCVWLRPQDAGVCVRLRPQDAGVCVRKDAASRAARGEGTDARLGLRPKPWHRLEGRRRFGVIRESGAGGVTVRP
jgi:hypothetical protein